MKKVLLFAIVLGSAVAFTSCSKSAECVCADGTTLSEDDYPSVLGISTFEPACEACDGTI